MTLKVLEFRIYLENEPMCINCIKDIVKIYTSYFTHIEYSSVLTDSSCGRPKYVGSCSDALYGVDNCLHRKKLMEGEEHVVKDVCVPGNGKIYAWFGCKDMDFVNTIMH